MPRRRCAYKIKILVLFLVLFWRRFGPITLKLPDAQLQLICFHMVSVSICWKVAASSRCAYRFWPYFFVFGSFQPLYWLYRSEITSCIFLSLKICIGISSYNVNHEKQIWPFFGQKFFQFLAHFRQLLWHNRLDIARCTTTVGGRLYGVTRMALICNA